MSVFYNAFRTNLNRYFNSLEVPFHSDWVISVFVSKEEGGSFLTTLRNRDSTERGRSPECHLNLEGSEIMFARIITGASDILSLVDDDSISVKGDKSLLASVADAMKQYHRNRWDGSF